MSCHLGSRGDVISSAIENNQRTVNKIALILSVVTSSRLVLIITKDDVTTCNAHNDVMSSANKKNQRNVTEIVLALSCQHTLKFKNTLILFELIH